jgi:hypothetical protein
MFNTGRLPEEETRAACEEQIGLGRFYFPRRRKKSKETKNISVYLEKYKNVKVVAYPVARFCRPM